MKLKGFIKNFKQADGKSERVEYLAKHMDEFVDYFMSGDFETDEYRLEMYDLFMTKKFAKAVDKYSDEYETKPELVSVISDVFQNLKDSNPDPKIIEMYSDIVRENLLRKRTKKLVKATGLPSEVAINILISCPSTVDEKPFDEQFEYIDLLVSKFYVIGRFIDNLEDTTKISDTILNTETLLKAFKTVLGDGMMDKVTSFILLADRKQMNKIEELGEFAMKMWEALTDVALLSLNYSGKKADIAEWLRKFYIKKRKKNNDIEKGINRRIDLTSIDEEKYPKVVKAVNILVEENAANETFLQ